MAKADNDDSIAGAATAARGKTTLDDLKRIARAACDTSARMQSTSFMTSGRLSSKRAARGARQMVLPLKPCSISNSRLLPSKISNAKREIGAGTLPSAFERGDRPPRRGSALGTRTRSRTGNRLASCYT